MFTFLLRGRVFKNSPSHSPSSMSTPTPVRKPLLPSQETRIKSGGPPWAGTFRRLLPCASPSLSGISGLRTSFLHSWSPLPILRMGAGWQGKHFGGPEVCVTGVGWSWFLPQTTSQVSGQLARNQRVGEQTFSAQNYPAVSCLHDSLDVVSALIHLLPHLFFFFF